MVISALRRLCVPFLVVAVTIALLALSSGESKATWTGSPQFQPIFDVKLCNPMDADFSGPAQLKGTGPSDCTHDTTLGPAGHPDTFTPFTVPADHMNYDQSFYVVAGGANETRLDGSQIAGPNPGGTTGAVGGGLQSLTTLGLAAVRHHGHRRLPARGHRRPLGRPGHRRQRLLLRPGGQRLPARHPVPGLHPQAVRPRRRRHRHGRRPQHHRRPAGAAQGALRRPHPGAARRRLPDAPEH
jgi:hypothetical protein